MDEKTLKNLIKPYLKNESIDNIVPLEKGYSSDKKFVVWCDGSPLYLLRINTLEMLDQKITEINVLKKLCKRGIRCPQPYGAGLCEDKSYSYSLVEYLVGESADIVLPNISDEKQYLLGQEAGQELHRIHQMKIDAKKIDWAKNRTDKYRWCVQKANELKLFIPSQRLIEGYVADHLALLETSRQVFRHDDYHPANMVIHNQTWSGIIDFERCDTGDPIEEFYKIPWFTIKSSVQFAKGQIDAYLALTDVKDFWKRYNLFVAMSFHSSLVWQHGSTPIKPLADSVAEIIRSHDWNNSGPPKWYDQEIAHS